MAKYRFDQIAINSTEKKKPVEEDRFTYLGLEHLDSGSLKVTRFGTDVAPIGEKLVMRKGDVLFGKRRAYQKKVAIAPFDGIFSAHGMVLRPKEDVVDRDFFPLFISSDYFLDAAIKISVGSLSPTINWRDLKELEFELPDLETQKRLAAVLWAMNETMDSYKALISATDELVKSQFIVEFGLPDENDHGYEIGSIGDVVCDVHYGTSKKASEDGEYTYLRMNNITYDGVLDLSDTKKISLPDKELTGCTVKKGDVLFNRTNSRDLVGKTCVFNQEEPMIIAGYIIRLRMNGRVLPEYLSTFLNLKSSKKMLMEMAKGAVGQANINAQEVQSIAIIIPPMEVQLPFARLIKQSDKSQFIEMFGDPELNPYGLPVKRFDEVATIDANMTTDYEKYADYPHIGIDSIEKDTGRLFGYRTVREDNVISGKYVFGPQHIIYSKIRPALNKVALPDFEGLCSADAYPILPKEGVCTREFLAHVMRSDYYLRYVSAFSGRSQMPKVNRKQISGFSFPVPPLEDQKEFVLIMEQSDKSKFAVANAISAHRCCRHRITIAIEED